MVYTKVLMSRSRSNTGPGPGPIQVQVRVRGPQKGAGPDLDRTLDSLSRTLLPLHGFIEPY